MLKILAVYPNKILNYRIFLRHILWIPIFFHTNNFDDLMMILRKWKSKIIFYEEIRTFIVEVTPLWN